jgi:DegV family protein with EDD domain
MHTNITMIKIVTDSTCDLAPETIHQLEITAVPMIVNIDGKDQLDGIDLSRQQFYDGLATYRDMPKTAANSPGMLAEAYRAAARAGATQIVSIHIARKVSGVCNAADIAVKDVAAEGIKVRVIDSGSMSLGMGWLCVTAAELIQQGATLEDVVDAVEQQRSRTRIIAMADTLKYLAKGGRVSALQAGLGELLQVKLLVELADGVIAPIDRVRTRGRGVERLLTEARKTPGPWEHFSIITTNGDQAKDVAAVQFALTDFGPMVPDRPTLVTPVIGAHFGPLGLGVVIVGK